MIEEEKKLYFIIQMQVYLSRQFDMRLSSVIISHFGIYIFLVLQIEFCRNELQIIKSFHADGLLPMQKLTDTLQVIKYRNNNPNKIMFVAFNRLSVLWRTRLS